MRTFICLIEKFNANNSDTVISKKKIFLSIFFVLLKSILNFKHFLKKMSLIADVFPEILAQKIWLDKCLKSAVSEHP